MNARAQWPSILEPRILQPGICLQCDSLPKFRSRKSYLLLSKRLISLKASRLPKCLGLSIQHPNDSRTPQKLCLFIASPCTLMSRAEEVSFHLMLLDAMVCDIGRDDTIIMVAVSSGFFDRKQTNDLRDKSATCLPAFRHETEVEPWRKLLMCKCIAAASASAAPPCNCLMKLIHICTNEELMPLTKAVVQ